MVRRGVPGHTRRRVRRGKKQKGGILGILPVVRRLRPPPRRRKQKGGLVLPRRQKGGILPLFLIPAAIAAAKAAALGAVGGAAGYGAKKAIEAASK